MPNIFQSIAESIEEDARGGVSAHVFPVQAGIVGGALGGLAMVVVALGYGVTSGRGIWYPVNMIAAVVIRRWQDAPDELLMQFNPAGLIFGTTIHLAMSVAIGALFALLLPTLPGHPFVWAFVVGPVLWFGALYAVLPIVNPVMAQRVDLQSFFMAHLVYSVVVGAWLERTQPLKIE